LDVPPTPTSSHTSHSNTHTHTHHTHTHTHTRARAQLLRLLDHCLDHHGLQELAYYPGVLRGVRAAQHPEAYGGLEYRFLHRGASAEEWVHEDSLDLRLLKTYRRTVVDEANAEAVRAALKRRAVGTVVVEAVTFGC
jgi:hypothetical protein